MEPLRPDFRQALKEAHPGLTDDVIDEYEKLTAMRYRLDAQRFRESVDEIERRRDALLRQRMPLFAQVAQMMTARSRAQAARKEPDFTVEIVRPPES